MIMTSGDVREVTGLSENLLRTWCERGLIPRTTEGRGHHRKFTVPQLVAVWYGAELVALGYGEPVYGPAMKFLCKLSEPQLQAELEAGRTLLLPTPHHLRLREVLAGEFRGTAFDIGTLYRKMPIALRLIQRQQVKLRAPNGRRRGLAIVEEKR